MRAWPWRLNPEPGPRPAHDVHVQVLHFLATVLAGVDQGAKTVDHAQLAHQLRRQRQHAPEQRLVLGADLVMRRRCAFFGITSTCTGAHGWMSWKARSSSSSKTFFDGIWPATILQKMQFGS